MTHSIVIIDDDSSYREILKRRISQTSNFEVRSFESVKEALAVTIENVHAILLDMMLENSSGLDAIKDLNTHFSPSHLIILTGYASIATTVEAMKRGATDYIAKPASTQEILRRIDGSAVPETSSLKPMTPAQAEWEHIHRVLLEHNGNISNTAEALGMHRRTLQRKIKKHAPRSN
ncbi:MAG: two component signal transduction system response regulator RegA [Idiomarinaceae bacterium HL-53]|nr:MAG: two component signal transduction system response regulator RegA [Idiomarinaceae bacterium HL-53]CUS48060.1 response regulator receiver protein [Idiomarinaceae bacterium HL-53]